MRRKRLVLGILILFLLLLVLVTFTSGIIIKSPQRKLANTFVQDILENKYSASYALFNSNAKALTKPADWQHTVAELHFFFEDKQTKYLQQTTNGTTEVFSYSITGIDNKPYQFLVTIDTKSTGNNQVQAFSSVQQSTNSK